MVNVAINGYGNLGKRVADAVAKQDDMKLVGVSKTHPNFEAYVAAMKGYSLRRRGSQHRVFQGGRLRRRGYDDRHAPRGRRSR